MRWTIHLRNVPIQSGHSEFLLELSNSKGTICYLAEKWNTGNSMKTKTKWLQPTKLLSLFFSLPSLIN